MEEIKEPQETQTKKFSYEELEHIATNLSNQVQHLSIELQKANMQNVFKRLDYCFKVIEVNPIVSERLFNKDFINKCAKEIEELMTIPEAATNE